MAHIVFLDDAALDDLRRIGPEAVPQVLKKILILEKDALAGHPLGGELTGYRKLVVGRNTLRVVYRVVGDAVEVCEVWVVGLRSDQHVYEEAAGRTRDAVGERPELRSLADAIARLGRLSAGMGIPTSPAPREPVPAWLATRLVHTAGLRPEQVAALDAEAALDAWTAFISTRRPGRRRP